MALIAQSDLENRISVSEVTKYSRGNSSLIVSAIAQAVSKARSAALNAWTAESWDAMTSTTLPPEALFHLVSDAVDILSAGSARPPEIQLKADEATKWRSYLAGDTVRCFDGVLIKRTSASGGDRARVGPPASNIFDREDTGGGVRFRIRQI